MALDKMCMHVCTLAHAHTHTEGISRFNMTRERTYKQMSSGQNSGKKAPTLSKPLTICVTNS